MQTLIKRIIWLSAPHVIINLLLCVYVIGGAVIFIQLDDKMAGEDFRDIVLFTFTTITTIGYGNISPSTDASKLFCIGYATFGIPLMFLSLANMGKFMSEAYWMSIICLTKTTVDRGDDRVSSSEGEMKMPFITLNFLLLFTIGTGAVLFNAWDKLGFIDASYFSFITVMTIGFGDLFPTAQSSWHCLAVIMYISCGMVVMSTFIGALNNYLRKIHYLGRTFTGAGEVNVWFGGQSVSVAELLQVVAAKFKVSPHELRALLRDLDGIIDSLTDDSIAASRTRRDSLIHMNAAATMEKRRPGPDGEIHDYTPLKTFLEKEHRKYSDTIGHQSIIWTQQSQQAPIHTSHKAIHALEVVYGASIESRRRHASQKSSVDNPKSIANLFKH